MAASRRELAPLAPAVQPIPALDRATLNHIHLRVKDLDISQRFYEEIFGWEPVMELPSQQRKMRFLRDSKRFLLVLEIHPDSATVPSWFHLGFELESHAEVQSAALELSRRSVKFIEPLNQTPDYSSFTVEDPDGYHLQIYWDSDKAAP
jgi:catechol 2,3-dioxygenase-like lactoylglutathione lyase family enzyme